MHFYVPLRVAEVVVKEVHTPFVYHIECFAEVLSMESYAQRRQYSRHGRSIINKPGLKVGARNFEGRSSTIDRRCRSET